MNTTFNSKEAAKQMIDGFSVKLINTDKVFCLSINNDINYSFGKASLSMSEFINFYDQATFQLDGKDLLPHYLPKIIWYAYRKNPELYKGENIFVTDKKYYTQNFKVLDWKIRYFPKTFEQCE